MNSVVHKLRTGQVTIGGWIAFASSYVAELMGGVGYDWVAIDWEHGAMHDESVQQMLQALHATRTPSLVRIPEHSLVYGQRALDMGAGGVIVPMVNSAKEAAEAVAALRFPPGGRRSVGLGRWRLAMDGSNPPEVNDEIAVIIMIERIEAVEQIDSILAVEGIDAFFVGPTDLGASLGYDPAKVEEAVQRAATAGRANGIPAGIHTHTPADARNRIGQGFQFIALAEAGRLIQHAAGEFLRTARNQ